MKLILPFPLLGGLKAIKNVLENQNEYWKKYVNNDLEKCENVLCMNPRPISGDLNLGDMSFASSDIVIYNKNYITRFCFVSGTKLQKPLEFLK